MWSVLEKSISAMSSLSELSLAGMQIGLLLLSKSSERAECSCSFQLLQGFMARLLPKGRKKTLPINHFPKEVALEL
eukprot:4462909-Amphidinium_carterae.1